MYVLYCMEIFKLSEVIYVRAAQKNEEKTKEIPLETNKVTLLNDT